MSDISKAYSYKLPDSYYGSTSVDGNTATAVYNGPAKGFVFVGAEDGVLHPEEGFHPWSGNQEDKDGMITRAGLSRRVVVLDCTTSDDDTVIAAICAGQNTSSDDWNTVSYTLDGESEPYHTEPDPLPLNDVYDVMNVTYDLEAESWNIDAIPFASAPMTMEEHKQMRDSLIVQAQEFIAAEENEVTADQTTAINAYITELQNLYTRFSGVHQARIGFPSWPINDPGPDDEQEEAGADVGPG
jgi:hypothetical protein